MGCLYKLTSPSGKSYIGITLFSFEKRFAEHVARATNKRGVGAIYSAIREYGADAFAREILAESDDWDTLCRMERDAITEHGTYGNGGYNMTIGGDGVHGLSLEVKARHRAATSDGTRRAWAETSLRANRAAAWDADGVRQRHSEATSLGTTAAYARPSVRENLRRSRADPNYRARVSASVSALWANQKYRNNQIEKRQQQQPRTEDSKRAQGDKMRALIAERKRLGTYWNETRQKELHGTRGSEKN